MLASDRARGPKATSDFCEFFDVPLGTAVGALWSPHFAVEQVVLPWTGQSFSQLLLLKLYSSETLLLWSLPVPDTCWEHLFQGSSSLMTFCQARSGLWKMLSHSSMV